MTKKNAYSSIAEIPNVRNYRHGLEPDERLCKRSYQQDVRNFWRHTCCDGANRRWPDSRETVIAQNGNSLFCDDGLKIVIVDRIERVAFVITGNASILDLSEAIYLDEVCAKRKNIFNAFVVVQNAFEDAQGPVDDVLGLLPGICVRAIQEVMKTNNSYGRLRGKQLFQVAIGTFDPEQGNSIFHQFSINLSDDGDVASSKVETELYNLDREPSLVLYGDAAYLQQAAFAAPARSF